MEPAPKTRFVLKALLAATFLYATWFHIRELGETAKAIVMLAVAVVATRFLAADIVHFPGWIARLVVRAQDGKLQGKLYVFDQVRMHLYLVGEEAWIAADGVKTLLKPSSTELGLLGKGYAIIPGTKVMGFSETALFQLIAKRERAGAGRDVLKLDNWLRHDALPNLRRLPLSSL
jgi:hypothetical protein